MSNVLVNKQKIDILANAISDKSGVPVTMTLDEMVEAVDGIETGGITPTGNIDITSAGVTDVTNYATVTVPAYDGIEDGYERDFYTENSKRKWRIRFVNDGTPGWHENYEAHPYQSFNAIATGTSVTPTENAQTIGGLNYMMQGAVTVNAIPSNYVGSGITRCTASDVVFVEDGEYYAVVGEGYYANNVWKEVPSGTAGTPTATKGTVSNHQVSVTPSVTNTAGYISGGTKTGTAVTVSASELVSGTYTVDSSGTKDVTNYASASVPAGTAGTPSASKGAVSNHSVSVTPSVTNTTGYIMGSTKTGTAVTVSASELASGNKAITQNGTGIDVVGYSTVSVNVPNNDVWKPIQAQTRTIIEDPDGNYLWYDNITPAFAEGQTWRVTWGNETYIVQTKYVEINNIGYWVIGNPGAIGYTDDGTGYSWIAWNQNSSAIAIGTLETGSKKVILELQQSNPYQAKTVTYTPSETQQTATVVPDSGYNGLSTVGVTVNAISSTYVGSGITRKSSTDLTISGATVTAPAGYYSAAASKTIDNAELVFNIITSNTPTIGNTSGTLTLFVSEANIITNSSSSSGYISVSSNLNTTIGTTGVYLYSNIPYNQNNSALTVSGATVTVPAGYYANQVTKSVASGSATAPASISGTAASVSTGTNTLTLTKTVSVTPTVSAGYINSGTAGNSSVSLTASVTTKAAATITPTTTNQTIAAGTYLTGTQTIAGDADLVGSNILSTANIFGVQGTVVVQNYYTGSSAPSSSLGSNGDLYLQA